MRTNKEKIINTEIDFLCVHIFFSRLSGLMCFCQPGGRDFSVAKRKQHVDGKYPSWPSCDLTYHQSGFKSDTISSTVPDARVKVFSAVASKDRLTMHCIEVIVGLQFREDADTHWKMGVTCRGNIQEWRSKHIVTKSGGTQKHAWTKSESIKFFRRRSKKRSKWFLTSDVNFIRKQMISRHEIKMIF